MDFQQRLTVPWAAILTPGEYPLFELRQRKIPEVSDGIRYDDAFPGLWLPKLFMSGQDLGGTHECSGW
jgi:hypothetical protein